MGCKISKGFSFATLLRVTLLCLLALSAADVRANLKPDQARKSITRMPGFELTSGSVRVKSVILTTAATAEAVAEIRTVFRLQQNEQGNWRVAEIRTRPAHWEQIDLIAKVLGPTSFEATANPCAVTDPPFKGASSIQPTVKRARCLLGGLLGIEVPSDAIRIQQVSRLQLPLGTQTSAVVIAWVRADVRLLNGSKGWQVTELRTGKSDWARLDSIIAAVNEMKSDRVRTELASIARALESFRRERGSYVVSDSHTVVIDYLSPRYLPGIIREDPWGQPYKYLGERERFTLRSLGPDGKENTPDDIEVDHLP